MLKFASRIQSLKASSIMEISAKAQELRMKGHDVVSLAAGEPDFNTPKEIQEAATQAMAEGITRYAPAPGFLAVREAISEMVTRENGYAVSPDEVTIVSGAKHGLYLAFQCLLDPGEAVLIPTPAWVSYSPMIELAGAEIIPLPLYEEDGYRPNTDRWKGLAIPPNAKGIILNSPNNPTGIVYSKEDLNRLVSWALQRNLWILSDEIYEKILYDGVTHTSVAALGPEAKNNTVTISGFSKSYAMTGWRLGWTIAPKDFSKKLASLQSQSNSHTTSFVQWAALTAAKLPPEFLAKTISEYDKRRHYCMKRLDGLKSFLTYTRPQGAFYLFVNLHPYLSKVKKTDFEFAQQILEQEHLALVPGSFFGKEQSLRLSYATSLTQLEKAFDRLENFLKKTS